MMLNLLNSSFQDAVMCLFHVQYSIDVTYTTFIHMVLYHLLKVMVRGLDYVLILFELSVILGLGV